MDNLIAYIPMDRRQALVHNQELAPRSAGAALFADISGFTFLAEMLADTLGKRRGAEELTRYLNQAFDALITALYRYGGSVISFSGDAITCWLDGDDGRRATAAALEMQALMAQFSHIRVTDEQIVSLTLKTAVAAGTANRFLVGSAAYLTLDIIAGALLERLSAADRQAKRGDVILDEAIALNLGALVKIQEWRTDPDTGKRYARITELVDEVAEAPWPDLPQNALHDDQAQPYLLPRVFHRIQGARSDEFLAELRTAVALFVNFSGIDYDADTDAPQKLGRFVRRVEQVIEKFDGSLLQITVGDKGSFLYAAFGAPIAHEDDVDRAASAAVELQRVQDELNFLRPLQIGITQGRAFVGAYGSSERRTYGALGDTVNLAARLMQAAEPGQILVSEAVYAGARSGLFNFEELPSIRVKGKTREIDIFRLVGAKTQSATEALEALFPQPLIGRRKIAAQLDDALDDLLEGEGSLVRLLGAAGMGKSHLAAQFSRQARVTGVQLALGNCQSITRSVLYYPWQQIFRSLLDLDGLSEADASKRVTKYLERTHPEWALRLPLLGDMLGLPIPDNPVTAAFDTEIRQQALFALLVEMLHNWAADQPLILMIENAHWLDEASQALLGTVAQQALSSSPIMLLLLQRPQMMGDEELLPSLNKLPYCHSVSLPEMRYAEIANLVLQQLGSSPSPLLLDIVRRLARGNPFFIQELILAMKQGGQIQQNDQSVWQLSAELLTLLQRANFVTQAGGMWQLKPEADLSAVALGMPDSIHGLVLSRLDRLPEAHKLTLKVSSVLGFTIDLALVTAVHPEHKALTEVHAEAEYMAKEEVVHEEVPEQHIFAFRHHTTQEVTYETLLYTQRRQLHQAVARTLVELEPEAVSPIAHHAYLGELWPLALEFNLRAGEQAKLFYANQQSIDFFQKALRAAQGLPETETAAQLKQIHLALGELLVSTGDYETAQNHLQATLGFAQAQGDYESEARCYRWFGRSHELRGEYVLALSWLERGLETLAGRDSLEAAEISLIAGLINIRQGDYDEALKLCERSLAVAEALDDTAVRARTYNLMGIVDHRRGESQLAGERLTLSLAYYQELHDIYGQATSYNLIANGHFMRGEWSRADRQYRRSLDQFTQIGDLYNQVLVNNNLGGIASKQGRLDAALGYYQRAVRLLEQSGGSLWVLGALHMNMGHTYIRRRELVQASEQLNLAQAYFAQAQQRDLLPELLGLQAEVAWRQGDDGLAETRAREGIALAQELSMPREEGHTLRILGEIAFGRQDLVQAEANLQHSYRQLAGTGDEYETAKAQLALARLYVAQGKHDLARQNLDACAATFDRLDARMDLEAVAQLQRETDI